MVLLELSVVPLGVGQSVSSEVAECVDLIDASGLDYQLHAMGTIVEGELNEVVSLMQKCVELLAAKHDRVTCSAKLDYRRGMSGRLLQKVQSVEAKLGRSAGR